MRDRLAITVSDWHAWSPAIASKSLWREWARAGGRECADFPLDNETEAAPLPMALRRRATPLGQRILASAIAAGGLAKKPRYILACRHGEFSRLLGILGSIALNEAPSPAEFSMSVHHALAGLLSIQAGNTQGHTAIAAGTDTFEMALLEAAACLADDPDTPVLLIYGDEPLTGAYAAYNDVFDTQAFVAAFALTGPNDAARGIELDHDGETKAIGEAGCGAREFQKFYLSGASSGCSASGRLQWRLQHVS